MECIECYSEENRITPLLEPRNCLENHKQYICGTCGRCICIDKDEKRNVQRWNFPFKSLEIAKLYLRTADFSMKKPCGVYEITNSKGRKSYKIFADVADLKTYLDKNKDKSCEFMQPVYMKDKYQDFSYTKVKFLDKEEIEQYISEQEKLE
ncbi:hypothetical protein KQI42_19205 [Tissierella sp. MSJ-40]|uniref:Uncharacterized protein n=1 Tax=Tissierella simiarum TaxID=2841534 RepID=A0ABS6ED10_9FIRM|nr:hypothetical protein [Tissierella simiarum]MBU5440124.1 hypothetical protein [Tissierella simiarum]